ncbi:MAG: hypothetical protein ACRC0Y_03520 [Fusobacteriaceae bacterium]
MFSRLFQKKANVEKELNEKMKQLELKLQEKEIELKRFELREKIGKFSPVRLEEIKPKEIKKSKEIEIQQFNPKQIEIFEKNLRDLKNENQLLKKEINNLKDKNNDSLLLLKNHKYRITMDKFYIGTKFNEILIEFHELQINFIDQLNDESWNLLDVGLKNYTEAKKQYLDLKLGKISFDIKTGALKGERINKVFSKNRKFCTYMNENYFEFMSDISEYNFKELVQEGFKIEQIEELLGKKIQYEKEFKL